MDNYSARLQALAALPDTQTMLRKERWAPRKELGQHFIVDADITDRIVFAHGDLTGKRVVEIGPGAGTLTRSILQYDVKSLDLIEKDPWAANLLSRFILPVAPGVVRLHEADALHYDYSKTDGEKIHIVANLPYNISTELLMRWLKPGGNIEAATVMLQQEVAERFIATAGDKHYGRPAIISYLYADAERVMEAPADIFVPPPKVHSCVLHMRFRETPRISAKDYDMVNKVAKALFAMRRKTIRNGFKSYFKTDPEPFLEAAGLEATRRAETMSPEEFCRLADVMHEAQTSIKT